MNIYERIKVDITQPYYQTTFSNDGQRFIAWYLRNIYGLDCQIIMITSAMRENRRFTKPNITRSSGKTYFGT